MFFFRVLKKSPVILLTFGILHFCLPATTVKAADFNPNFIISDAQLQDYMCMGKEDIRSFLNSAEGYISNMRTLDIDGQEKSIAEIIYGASQTYKINPKYTIVKLQKEQSLVTDKNPTQKQLNWATGYGVCDSCSMDDPSIQKFKGIAAQIDNAAGIMRWYFDHTEQSFIKKPNNQYNIDGTLVQPINFATGFLYTYTPHLQGNQNFWKLWQKWFDQVYPDGSLIQGESSSTIYLIQDSKKRPFTTKTALTSRYNPKMVIIVPDSEIARYSDGKPVNLPNYSIMQNNGTYYLLDYDTVYPFFSHEVVSKLGYNPDEIIDVTTDDLQNYATGTVIGLNQTSPLGRLIKLKENNQLYYLKDNFLNPISDPQIAKINFLHLSIETSTIADLGNIQPGTNVVYKDGTLIGIKGFNKIYVMEDGLRRHIPDQNTFDNLGYQMNNVVWADEPTVLNIPTGSPLNVNRSIRIADSEPGEGQAGGNTVMITTPANKTTYIGKKIDTPVNTYLIADSKGKVLAGKNIDDVRPLASFTKVMTGYRLMKEKLPLAKVTTYKNAKFKSTFGSFRLAEGEKTLNSDILSSMLISSINSAAIMLVANVDSNQAAFVKRMNKQAQDWGLKKTNFADVSGENTKSKSTAREYLTIYSKSLTNPTLQEYLGSKSYNYFEVLDKDGMPKHFDANSNLLLKKNGLSFKIVNSKTGYLDEAGAGLVMQIERLADKKRFYIITMGNPDYPNRFDEPEKIANWAMTNL